jgi:hypothetical protein
MMTSFRLGILVLAAAWVLIAPQRPAWASHDLPQRLRHDAQVQSNNGHYTQAQQLRAIADSLKDKDASTARQIQSEIGKGNIDKAMDLLRAR